MKILVCIESYLPGTLGGGPVRALENLIDHLQAAHQFFIFTRNRDYLSSVPYPDIEANVWHQASDASIFYADGQDCSTSLIQQIEQLQPDWIYLNGALPPLTRSVLGLRSKLKPAFAAIPVLIAPHGNLSVASLAHNRWRKRLWLVYAKALGLTRGVIWHAASEREAHQIHSCFGGEAPVRVVPMAPAKWNVESGTPKSETFKEVPLLPLSSQVSALRSPPSALRLVYFGRLSPEKNLLFAFELLNAFAAQHPQQSIVYDVIGAGEAVYEAKLRAFSAKLPGTVQVNFVGQLSPSALQARLNSVQSSSVSHQQTPHLDEEGCPQGGVVPGSDQSSLITHHGEAVHHSSSYHALLMPSLTENFSFTVLESLQAGLPVLISDQTPWRDLDSKGIGWDLPLGTLDQWCAALASLTAQSRGSQSTQRATIQSFVDDWEQGYLTLANGLFRADG